MLKDKRLWVILAGLLGFTCLAVCIACVVGSGLGSAAYNFASSGATVGIGHDAPDFELTTLSGDVIRLSQFRGGPTLISFGTTWCPGCRDEAATLQRLHLDYPELVVLLVDREETHRTVQAFADEHGLTFPIVLDHDGKVSRQYRVYAIPSLFFVDSQGVIQARYIGEPTEAQLEESLAAIGVVP